MAVHASHSALPYPVKGARFSLLLEHYASTTNIPTDPGTPDTERSLDGAAFADCTEEVSVITGSNGMSLMTMTGDETNCSALAIASKAGSGSTTFLQRLYPRVLPAILSGTAQAGAAGTITLPSAASQKDDAYNGCIVKTTGGTGGGGGSGSQNNQARVITDYVGSTRVATISPSWETTPDATTTLEVLMTDMAVNAMIGHGLFSGLAETGVSYGQLLSIMGAVLAGETSGAATLSMIFKAIGNAGTTRLTATLDGSGNRIGQTLSLPGA
jgi:hypothetical protein